MFRKLEGAIHKQERMLFMKKVVTLLLSISLIFTAVSPLPVSSAETEITAGDDANSAKSISLGTDYYNSLDDIDTHWYKFTAPQKAYYNIRMETYTGSSKVLRLSTKSVKELAKSDYLFSPYYLSVELNENETYYLSVSSYYNSNLKEGTYGFSVNYKSDDEGTDFSNAYTLKLNSDSKFSFDGIKDADYFVFYGNKNTEYTVDFTGFSGNSALIHKCTIYDENMGKLKELYIKPNVKDSFSIKGSDTYYFMTNFTNTGHVIDFNNILEYSLKISSINETKKYEDVPAGSYGETSILFLSNYGIIQGDQNGRFNPNNTLTRAEAARILCMMLKEKNLDVNVSTEFHDVRFGHWASAEIAAMTKKEIIHGYGNGLFGPEDNVTGHQLLTLLVNAAGRERDAINRGGFPHGHTSIAKESGYLTGVANIDLSKPINRATVAIIVANAIKSDFFNLWN